MISNFFPFQNPGRYLNSIFCSEHRIDVWKTVGISWESRYSVTYLNGSAKFWASLNASLADRIPGAVVTTIGMEKHSCIAWCVSDTTAAPRLWPLSQCWLAVWVIVLSVGYHIFLSTTIYITVKRSNIFFAVIHVEEFWIWCYIWWFWQRYIYGDICSRILMNFFLHSKIIF